MGYKKRVLEYVFSNLTAVLWSTFLLFGGAIFFAYYYSIEYMPKLDLASSVTLVATASVTALILTIAFAFAFIFPGAVWRETVDSNSILKRLWHDNNHKKYGLQLLIWFVVPMLATYVSLIFWVYQQYPFSLLVFLLCFIALYFVSWHRLNLKLIEYLIEYVKYWAFSFLCFLCSCFTFLLVYRIESNFAEKETNWLSVSLTIVFILLTNFLVIVKPENIFSFYWYSILGLITFAVVTGILLNQLNLIPSLVMKQFQFGNINNSFIVLKEEGCHIVDKYTYSALQEANKNQAGNSKTTQKTNIENALCILTDINIISRLGEEYYLEVKKDNQKLVRFTIPSSNVVSHGKEHKQK